MTFDPVTAYASDWRFRDGVQDALHYDLRANSEARASATCKVIRDAIWQDDPAGQRLAAEAGIVRFLFWKITDDQPDPKHGDRLEVTEPNGITLWTVQTVEEIRIPSYWRVSCTKAAQNG